MRGFAPPHSGSTKLRIAIVFSNDFLGKCPENKRLVSMDTKVW